MRYAGWAVLLGYLNATFDLLSHAISAGYDFARHWDPKKSAAPRSDAPSAEQHWHLDLDPRRGIPWGFCVSNISFWSYWLRLMTNSVWNVTRFHSKYDTKGSEYSSFVKRFDITNSLLVPDKKLSTVMAGTTALKLRRAWKCYCRFSILEDFKQQTCNKRFREMQLMNAELEPLIFVAFDTRHIHGGGALPGKAPRRLRLPGGSKCWLYRYGRVHFRCSLIQHWCLCCLGCLTYVFCHRCHHYFVPKYLVSAKPAKEGEETASESEHPATLADSILVLG